MMERQVGQVVRLIDDLLDISRITLGKMQVRKERIELGTVVQSAVELALPLIEASAHELSVTLPPEPTYLDADPARLTQVFSNLLNNAAKYTDRAGRIWLAAERQGSDVVVSVKDTGIGIAAEMLPRIFEMFSQVKPALERSQGGLGIGLSLVRELVKLHGGSIEARSAGLGKGSEFLVRLPVLLEKPVQEPTQPGADEEPKSVAKSRLLIVDDLKDSADSLAIMLQIMGHEVHTAYETLRDKLPADVRAKTWLVHLGNGYDKVNAGMDGFAGIVKQGQEFEV